MMNRFRAALLLSAAVSWHLAAISTAATITVGDHTLLVGVPDQTIDILISGGDFIQGADLFLLVGDGTAGPLITDVDLIGPGTLFASNNTGQFQVYSSPSSRERGFSVTTDTG